MIYLSHTYDIEVDDYKLAEDYIDKAQINEDMLPPTMGKVESFIEEMIICNDIEEFEDELYYRIIDENFNDVMDAVYNALCEILEDE